MCYICTCFSSIVDLIQRLVTFGLSCCLCGAVVFGLSIAMIAGIAYGYNYCMAEFITFTRQDVNVYMRRGQFYDKLNLPHHRKSGSEDDSFSGVNKTGQYRDPRRSGPNDNNYRQAIAGNWMQSNDGRRAGESLSRNPPKLLDSRVQQDYSQARKDDLYSRMLGGRTGMPHALMPTVTWRRGMSDIIMRNFKPLQEINSGNTAKVPNDLFPSTDDSMKSLGYVDGHQEKNNEFSDIKEPRSYMNAMREWEPSTMRPYEAVSDDVDEDNVYKPV